jgi:glycosyltransferase involved in cell wall biosynthesis
MNAAELASYRRKPDWTNLSDGGSRAKKVSVVIPTYNVRENIRNTLDSLAQQTYPKEGFEVIVVDNGSTDGTLEEIRRVPVPFDLRYFYQERSGRQVGLCRNIGLANALGALIVFVDADCMCSANLIARHAELHGRREKSVVLGEIRMVGPNGCVDERVKIDLASLRRKRLPTQPTLKGRARVAWCHWWQQAAHFFEAKMTLWMSGANSSVKRRDLVAVGGYDEDFDHHWGDEDAELGYRLQKMGLKFVYAPEAMIFHQWHETSKSGVPGRNRVMLLLKHPELIGARLLMRHGNPYRGRTPEELERMIHHVAEEARNYY